MMRDWILLAVAIGTASAAAARAQSGAPDGGAAPPPPQIVVVPETPAVADAPLAAPDGGAPAAVAGAPGEADGGSGEEIILLVPKKPPPPPEPPKQIHVTVMHQPRPRVEWGQATLELGASTGVFVLGSGALFAGELIPIFIADGVFNAADVATVMLHVFSLANAVLLPLATTMTIERVKAYSTNYQLEGLGWWATYGSGLVLQLISAGFTFATPNVGTYLTSVHPWVFGALTPISQTVVANVLAAPRDPSAPLEGMARAPPVLLDGKGRPIPIVHVVSLSF